MTRSQWSGRRIIREERWSRIYEAEDGSPVNVSKFLTDEISVSEDVIKDQWESWSQSEKTAFARAFAEKPKFSGEDERILDFLMGAGDERVWVSIASGLPRHSQGKRVLNFLIDRLKSGSEPKANYMHALSTLGDSQAVLSMKDLYKRISGEIAKAGTKADKLLIFEFVVCCSSLAKLEGSSAYQDEIRPFLNHPDEHVRAFSKIYLEGGPPTHRF